MYALGYPIIAASQVIGYLLTVWTWVIIINAVLTWVRPDPGNPIVLALDRLSEPALRPFRRWVPAWQVGLDLSPLFAILAIQLVQRGILPILERFGRELSR